ncbi:hypothetical protein [Streptomyces sp. NPDC086835]|uniref:hypothetical protein n=1 Tax=Streptomyces sp. NPDC086835 TaxID=3365761 RepID=UPI003815D3DB
MTESRGLGPRTGAEDTGPELMADGAIPRPADVLARLGRSWTWVLGSAVATLVPGLLVLVWLDGTLHVLAVVVAVLGIVAGIVVLALPMESARALIRLLGLWLVLLGLAEAAVALGWRAALRMAPPTGPHGPATTD